jgi:hypothetical protein
MDDFGERGWVGARLCSSAAGVNVALAVLAWDDEDRHG